MAEQIFQKRGYELEEYTQLNPGEPGYEDPATVWMVVDKTTWAEMKKISLLEFISDLHKEQGPVVFNSVNVVEVYDVVFSTANYYLRIDAWRLVDIGNGETTRQSIAIKNLVKTVGGFTLELHDYKAGDVIDYIAFE